MKSESSVVSKWKFSTFCKFWVTTLKLFFEKERKRVSNCLNPKLFIGGIIENSFETTFRGKMNVLTVQKWYLSNFFFFFFFGGGWISLCILDWVCNELCGSLSLYILWLLKLAEFFFGFNRYSYANYYENLIWISTSHPEVLDEQKGGFLFDELISRYLSIANSI